MLNSTLRSVIELPNSPHRKKKTLHSILPNENGLFIDSRFAFNNKNQQTFNEIPDITFNAPNLKLEPTSPIMPISPIFRNEPLSQLLSRDVHTTSKSVLSTNTLTLNSFKTFNPSNSRIMIAKCNEPLKLISILKCYFKNTDLTMEHLCFSGMVSYVIIGWYDIRDVFYQINYLNSLIVKYNIENITIQPITPNEPILENVMNNPRFRILEACFDTIYLYFSNCTVSQLDVNSLQQETYNHLLKYGSIYEIEFLDKFNCFKCKFFNIKTSFIIAKINKIIVNNFKCYIFQTLIDLKEFIIKKPYDLLVDVYTLENYQFPPDEWKKNQWLKFRRLGTLPFINKIENFRNQNSINLDKILNGEDERVTLMIKNIPNKVNHEDLKKFVDQTSFGDYNFLYLRIDFKNHCNVGYAFISFKSPLHIIKFYRERNNEKWPKYKSSKVCQLAYAKVQGFNNLVEKFKNSMVMNQTHAYHPKIYFTDGSKRGQEMCFPL